jgi:hypothetical protein
MVKNRHNKGMDIQELRRQQLREWIKFNHESVVMRFAAAINKPQPQVADMLSGRKSFGEKVARQIEQLAKMPPMYLDTPPGGLAVREPTLGYHGVQLTRAGALLAAEWEKLDVAKRLKFETKILAEVAKGVRSRRKPPKGDRPTKQ